MILPRNKAAQNEISDVVLLDRLNVDLVVIDVAA